MEEITIKDSAPYLPYKLRGFNHLNKIVEFTLSDASYHLDKGFKPILHPPSDLTKEIEHNGEKFIPLKVIGEKIIPNSSFLDGKLGWDFPTGGDDYQDYYMTISFEKGNVMLHTWMGAEDEGGFIIESEHAPLDIIELLHEWYFDTKNLIKRNLAIDINTIK